MTISRETVHAYYVTQLLLDNLSGIMMIMKQAEANDVFERDKQELNHYLSELSNACTEGDGWETRMLRFVRHLHSFFVSDYGLAYLNHDDLDSLPERFGDFETSFPFRRMMLSLPKQHAQIQRKLWLNGYACLTLHVMEEDLGLKKDDRHFEEEDERGFSQPLFESLKSVPNEPEIQDDERYLQQWHKIPSINRLLPCKIEQMEKMEKMKQDMGTLVKVDALLTADTFLKADTFFDSDILYW